MPKLKNNLWKWTAQKGAWFFLTVDKSVGETLKKGQAKPRGWGSIRVRVTIGKTTWDTSIFPDKKKGYVLPVKASVRKKEDLKEGDKVSFYLEPIWG